MEFTPFDPELRTFGVLSLLFLYCLGGWLIMFLRILLTYRNMPVLSKQNYPHHAPLVSVIVPACNEASNIAKTLRSLIIQTYPNVEILAINDRSSDETGKIMRQLSQESARLRYLEIEQLPDDWLGKNHACQKGYELAKGEYFLFTDADVTFQPDVLEKTVAYAAHAHAEHIVTYPKLRTENIFEYALIALFGMLFTWKFNPGEAKNPKNKTAYVGVGAFNFISRRAYETLGTHRRLRAEVADDVMLGYYAKQAGFGTHILNGYDKLSVRWREGFLDTLRGIERSGFPGVNYSWLWVLAGVFGSVFGLILPYWLLFFPGLLAKITAAISFLLIWLSYVTLGNPLGKSAMATALHPFITIAFMYALVKSAVKITMEGGVWWRETFYPLELLKQKVANPSNASSYQTSEEF
ncbi:glycosyl transferase family 2 [Chloroherpeton thalassium ATCC 35110]|uniref:Glycosyl transferase family 2 n=1 Tax=Chloroherpeton thalassium (strain ATCC 35110 / GB-78) TaxID=517418 RepID=B3QV28_CHLT3|nr:glycosyltransferase family 2 protein [Chloroherpeton thalassium]ACF12982.1 glycosyl transferase family 2 [Chloroherpeton thalassium ATCC 35110]